MAITIEYKSGNNWIELPSPVSLKRKNEIIWSSNTGRNSNGEMKGDVVANKTTFDVQWGVLSASERSAIVDNIPSGFVSLRICGTVYTVYRGNIESDYLGVIGNITYYKSVQTELIER